MKGSKKVAREAEVKCRVESNDFVVWKYGTL